MLYVIMVTPISNQQTNKLMITLKEVLSIQSCSKDSSTMEDYIISQLQKINDIEYWQDEYNNIFVIAGNPDKLVPCFICHTDTVHQIIPHYKVIEDAGVLFSINPKTYERVGVGGDDKVGIYICLKALQAYQHFRCVFFANEEIGCIGSNNCDMSFFDNCTVVLQADRKGNSDFIDFTNGIEIFGDDFFDAIQPILTKYNYKVKEGLYTDVGTLKQRGLEVAAANISCGYYDPHSDNEYVVTADVERCKELMFTIASKCTEKQVHIPIIENYEFSTPFYTNELYQNYNPRIHRDYNYKNCIYCENCGEPANLKTFATLNADLCEKCITYFNTL